MNDEYRNEEHITILEKENESSEEIPETSSAGGGMAQPVRQPGQETPVWKPAAGTSETLFGIEETQHFRARWNEIQAKFVDEPAASVREADALVNELMSQLSQMIATQRRTLEGHWNREDVATEDLRQIIMSYRTLLNRLLI